MSTTIHVGNALDVLAKLPSESVHCCVTSPPYWGLRSYTGEPGMIGLEPTFDEHLVESGFAVFREVRRVLRSMTARSGSTTGMQLCWRHGEPVTRAAKQSAGLSRRPGSCSTKRNTYRKRERNCAGYKPKDLMMMPARVAMALQADGWWLRSEIIWHKPNPMPESCTDRPTNAHEKLFLLTKSIDAIWTHRLARRRAVAACS